MENKRNSIELIIANEELAFQNEEREKRAHEYSILNEELTESLNQIRIINKELILAKVKAEESDKLKSIFLANMSHEIRTPMNAIMGFSELLLDPGLSIENQAYFSRIIHSSSQQLLSVISDILDISKIEAGQINISSELININTLLNELYLSYKKTVELKNIKLYFTCEFPNQIIQVTTDGSRIRQIFCNLLNNSLKFTKTGEINFGYSIKNDFIEFFVSDTGMGIAKENQELIFQRFRQVDATSNCVNGGNGLGLSISKALIEKLGGTISVNSNLGEGTTFFFTIPNVRMNSINISSQPKTVTKKVINGIGKTILVAEDEIYNYAYIEEILSATNLKILHAWNGNEAVEYVKNNANIALVLMDIKMPKMDGYEAMHLIKSFRPKLPVIVQTAYALKQDKDQSLQAGFDDYIPKPIQKNAFINLIAGYLN
jgi:signal transduction histidine kinase/CheY-like chemotaxis protein